MRYGLHEIDKHHTVEPTVAADRDEALEWPEHARGNSSPIRSEHSAYSDLLRSQPITLGVKEIDRYSSWLRRFGRSIVRVAGSQCLRAETRWLSQIHRHFLQRR